STSLGSSSTSKIRAISAMFISLLRLGQQKIKGCALAHFRFSPDVASMALNDALNRRQTNPRAFEFIGSVEALKYAEQFAHVFTGKTDPVIFNENNDPVLSFPVTANFDLRHGACSGEFNGIGD